MRLGVAAALAVSAPGAAVATLGASAGCGPGARPAPRTRLTVKQIVERSKPAIVRVEVGRDRVGTGFAVSPDGLIATNLHVVAGATEISVRMLDGATYAVARIAAYDPSRDLALLDIDPGAPIPSLTLGDSDKVAAGDPVIAIGNPLGVLDYTVSDGLISSVRVVSTEPPELTLLQISAPISQGSSGGPLFNPFGEVIGVSTAIFTGGQNLNFGVPSKYVAALLAQPAPMSLEEFAAATPLGPPAPDAEVTITRQVPIHDLAVLDGCDAAQMAEVAQGISEAISVGAPLYNAGNHEACFRVYEGTSMRLEQGAACAGVRAAFTSGLTRAATLTTFKEKAWALRDTFDGLLDVILRKARADGLAPPE